MSEEAGNPGRIAAQEYKADPINKTSPTSTHSEFERGVRAELLLEQGNIENAVLNLQDTAPTTDQKDSLDGNVTLNAGNPVASLADLAAQQKAQTTRFTFRTAIDAPADQEVKINNVIPASATIVNASNINAAGTNIGNLLLLLGTGDKVVITNNANAAQSYNYDITGSVTQIGGAGSGGYVAITVTFFAAGTGGNLADSTDAVVNTFFDGSSSEFLSKALNLSDLASNSTARTNLDVFSKSETKSRDKLSPFRQTYSAATVVFTSDTLNFRFNNADPTLATFIYFGSGNAASIASAKAIRDAMQKNNFIFLGRAPSEGSGSTSSYVYKISGDVTTDAFNSIVPVVFVEQGTGDNIANGELADFTVYQSNVITTNMQAALTAANSPNAGNAFATIADVPALAIVRRVVEQVRTTTASSALRSLVFENWQSTNWRLDLNIQVGFFDGIHYGSLIARFVDGSAITGSAEKLSCVSHLGQDPDTGADNALDSYISTQSASGVGGNPTTSTLITNAFDDYKLELEVEFDTTTGLDVKVTTRDGSDALKSVAVIFLNISGTFTPA